MDHRPDAQVLTVIAVALTFASGAMDVASFTRLGTVFTSVMTGNIVLWGLAAARGSLTLASHTAVAIIGYIVGVAGGSRIAVGGRGAAEADGDGKDGDAPAGEGRAGAWPAHVTWALLAELGLLGGFAVGWEITGARPGGWVQFFLLAVAAAGMGVQSSAVKNMGLTEVSTTYLTGTLTGLVSSLVSPGPRATDRWRRLGVLLGLAAGASLTGLLVATAPDGVPGLPLAALVTCVVLATWPRTAGQARGKKGGER
ncbi:MAG TPA: YoaK family protein [Streptosporangiaceae bacterium]